MMRVLVRVLVRAQMLATDDSGPERPHRATGANLARQARAGARAWYVFGRRRTV